MSFLDKLLQKLDRIDADRLSGIVKTLVRERTFLGRAFNLLSEGVVVTDARGKIRFVNESALQFLSERQGVHEGRDIAAAIPDGELKGLVEKALLHHRGIRARELTIEEPNKFRVTLNVVPIENSAGTFQGAVIMLHDVAAERDRHLKSAMHKRMEALAILAAGIAHEVGNPLNSLGIHLQLLHRKVEELPEERRKEFLELIEVSGEEVSRLEHIIGQFLKAIRPSASTLQEDDMVPIVEKTLDFLEPELQKSGVKTIRKFSAHVPPLMLNPDQVRQVCINIVRNAIQAMPDGGTLDVTITCERGCVLVGFADCGVGIPPYLRDKVLEPYFTTKEGGAGLGLMIVNRIMNEHGGDMAISSTPGEGTGVTLSFPVPVRYRKLLRGKRGNG